MRKKLINYKPWRILAPGSKELLSKIPLAGSFEALYEETDVPTNAYEEEIKVLYKYRALGNRVLRSDGTTATQDVEQILQTRQLYAATRLEMNDPFELKVRCGEISRERFLNAIQHLALDLPPEDAKSLVDQSELVGDNHISEANKVLVNHASEQLNHFRIVSLTERNNDALMWAYYGGSNRGVCLGFRVTENNGFTEALRVNYRETPPQHTFEDYELGKLLEEATLGKSLRWSHEQEWRVVMSNPSSPEATSKFMPFTESCVVEIIFGSQIEKESEERVRAASARLKGVLYGRINEDPVTEELTVVWDN